MVMLDILDAHILVSRLLCFALAFLVHLLVGRYLSFSGMRDTRENTEGEEGAVSMTCFSLWRF